MPRKTSINNLNIVWQGQSWSVIAPNGVVIGRFKNKFEAEHYAQNTKDYVSNEYEDYTEDNFYQPPKRKRNFSIDGELETDEYSVSEPPKQKKDFYPEIFQETASKSEPNWNLKKIAGLGIGAVVISGIGYVAVPSLMSSLVEQLSPIFFGPASVPLLIVLALVVPVSLVFANDRLPELLKIILGWPLMLLGIVFFVIFLIIGILLLIYSLFSPDIEFFRTLITFGLVVFISFAAMLGGAAFTKQFPL